MSAPVFDDAFRLQLLDLFKWRRDVRHFRPTPVPPDLLDGLLDVAGLAEMIRRATTLPVAEITDGIGDVERGRKGVADVAAGERKESRAGDCELSEQARPPHKMYLLRSSFWVMAPIFSRTVAPSMTTFVPARSGPA